MIQWDQCGIIILAAGQSVRFGGDKLVASLRGRPLALYAANTATSLEAAQTIAVIPPDAPTRRALFASTGIETLENPEFQLGQGTSLALGVRAMGERGVDAVLLLLADMPFVAAADLRLLVGELGDQVAAIAESDGIVCPPAIFRSALFPALSALTDDRGAKSILQGREDVRRVPFLHRTLADIDTFEEITNETIAENAL